MGNYLPSKLTIIFSLLIILSGCSSAKKIAGENYLLEKNVIFKNNQELINDPLKFLLVNQPNKKNPRYSFQKKHLQSCRNQTRFCIQRLVVQKAQNKEAFRQMAFPKTSKGIGAIQIWF